MTLSLRTLVVVYVAVFVVLAPASEVRALDEAAPAAAPAFEGTHVELAAHGELVSPPVAGGISPFGWGGGGVLRAIASHVVLGARGAAFAGGSDSTGMSERAVLLGGELGYELRLGRRLTVRPMLGAGGALITESVPSSAATRTSTTSGNGRVRSASAVDVVTQATSLGGSASSGGTGTSTSSSSSTAGALYLAPSLEALMWLSELSFFGAGARVIYLPSVPYGTDGNAKWLSYGLDLSLGVRF